MNPSDNSYLDIFNKEVGLKFQLYNSLFTALPFHKVEKTGVLVSIFMLYCEENYEEGKSPIEIIRNFLKQYTSYQDEHEELDLLFRFVQYSERQVVLFDALEDAAFPKVNDLGGSGTLNHLHSEVVERKAYDALKEKFKEFSVRLVLTAHPTQFYPSEVLVIINDLAEAIIEDNTALVNTYLQQLGKTPFFKSIKPTPYDEAVNLIWYLENVFYHAGGEILSYINNRFPETLDEENRILSLGFWPGGDRDGNPFVKSDTALSVSRALRSSILKCYHDDVRELKRRLTFKGVADVVGALEEKLYRNIFLPTERLDISKKEILQFLDEIALLLKKDHNSLFLESVEKLIRKVRLFGMHFASLDIRQDSKVHSTLLEQIARKTSLLPSDYNSLTEDAKMSALLNMGTLEDTSVLDDEIHVDVIDTIRSIRTIQKFNGEPGCHRYIISHTQSALQVLELAGLFRLSGWQAEEISVDIVPLFESIEDLANAAESMRLLYSNDFYRKHLERRSNKQTIMLGFSDGTKDGGFLSANWGIYKAKEALSALGEEFQVDTIFFDGRGGPPARGGGRTQQFYASMGSNIANKEIQLTIQGQTVSSNFGTIATARYNMEQLMHAGIRSSLFSSNQPTLSKAQDKLIDELSGISYQAYTQLKNTPKFLEYLNFASPLRYYSEANIGSRPSKRKPGKLNLEDLRAVPYVGAWSQLKQNLPGYYGLGTSLKAFDENGRWEEIRKLFQESAFFRTIIDNSEMAMTKCFFPLTAYLANNKTYGSLWNMIHEEFEITKSYILKLKGTTGLMEEKPVSRLSIQMRQRIELPLLTIQQYALNRIRELEAEEGKEAEKNIYEKLAMRCSFGIINAERNSA